MASRITGTLHEDRTTLRQIVQASPIPTFVINASHTVIHWNRALENLCGHGAVEMVGSRRQWVIFRAAKRATIADAIVAGEPVDVLAPYNGGRISPSERVQGAYEAEAFFPNMGDNGKWLFITAAPIRQADGTIVGAIETLWDKTDEKRAAMERERRNTELSALCAISDALCASMDLQERLDSACREIAAFLPVEGICIFEWDAAGGAKPIFTFGAAIDRLPAGQTGPLDAWVRQVAETGKYARFDGATEFPGGGQGLKDGQGFDDFSLIPVRTNGTFCVIALAGGTGKKYFPREREVLSLIGNRIGAAIENTMLHERLIDAERLAAVGQTVAGMAHYIKNILSGLKGGSYVVDVGLDTADPVKLKAGWQAVQRSISRISDLVADLLTFSKKREPECQPCAPNDIAREVCALLRERARKNRIEIATDFDPDIPEVLMDPRSIHRCLLNLVANAIDACIADENRPQSWRVHVRTALEKSGSIRFEVRDNGTGMDAETRERLFSPFFSTKGEKGTGLGLLVTKKLVEEQQGIITVDSCPGGGSTFSFKLPYAAVKQG